jgi:aryl-alcohol dehydrogenase-like predicted oxidoreductase
MSFGDSRWAEWVQGEQEALHLIKKAYDSGINFFDTADAYSNGESERILGRVIRKLGIPRQNLVIATKVYGEVSSDPSRFTFVNPSPPSPSSVNNKGLSRKHIFEAVEASLERLQMDYIDLYQIHRFDPETPIEETMEALNDLVRSGKVRYIGASSMYAWQFNKFQNVAEKRGWTKFVSMQNMVNLIYREEEREMIPLCNDQGVGIIPWSPLARGLLGAKPSQVRTQSDVFTGYMFNPQKKNNDAIIERIVEVAEKKGVEAAQIAIAWVLAKEGVTAPIIGFSKEVYLDQAIGALKVKLSEEEIKYLEELYQPRPITGFF